MDTCGIVRQERLAGRYYPALSQTLAYEALVQLRRAQLAMAREQSPSSVRAIIAPHAAWRWCQSVAAAAFAPVLGAQVGRVVILAPAHRAAVRGAALAGASRWHTPLGDVLSDEIGERALSNSNGVALRADAHAHEHSIEVILPWLQVALQPGFSVLPVLCGVASPEFLLGLLRTALSLPLLGDMSTLVVVSTDLSHGLSTSAARPRDELTAGAIEGLDPTRLSAEGACGWGPLSALLVEAKLRGWTPLRRALAHSGDVAGPQLPGVGYGAWTFQDSLSCS